MWGEMCILKSLTYDLAEFLMTNTSIKYKLWIINPVGRGLCKTRGLRVWN